MFLPCLEHLSWFTLNPILHYYKSDDHEAVKLIKLNLNYLNFKIKKNQTIYTQTQLSLYLLIIFSSPYPNIVITVHGYSEGTSPVENITSISMPPMFLLSLTLDMKNIVLCWCSSICILVVFSLLLTVMLQWVSSYQSFEMALLK